ncbi:MAG: DUF6434 domain-containing protein, partial [Agathobacter sp.]|nr:DUF6434 domain-containing protein [Lachnospiraceae bacterium]MDY2619107.1 DUF6434 domain-containing protein [Agathobacter sp.]
TEKIGKSFSFNVLFQKWLKGNAGKTYGDAINAYYQILEEKKKGISCVFIFTQWVKTETGNETVLHPVFIGYTPGIR